MYLASKKMIFSIVLGGMVLSGCEDPASIAETRVNNNAAYMSAAQASITVPTKACLEFFKNEQLPVSLLTSSGFSKSGKNFIKKIASGESTDRSTISIFPNSNDLCVIVTTAVSPLVFVQVNISKVMADNGWTTSNGLDFSKNESKIRMAGLSSYGQHQIRLRYFDGN